MKPILKTVAEVLLLILLLPQIFVFLYFFWSTVRIGFGGFGMMKDLASLGLAISLMSAPFLYVLYFAIRRVNRDKARGLATFLICLVSGYAGVVAWNVFIFENFSYFWGLIPVLICSGGTALYIVLREKERQIPPYGGDLFLANEK